jgi:hypothetical protein
VLLFVEPQMFAVRKKIRSCQTLLLPFLTKLARSASLASSSFGAARQAKNSTALKPSVKSTNYSLFATQRQNNRQHGQSARYKPSSLLRSHLFKFPLILDLILVLTTPKPRSRLNFLDSRHLPACLRFGSSPRTMRQTPQPRKMQLRKRLPKRRTTLSRSSRY